MPRSHSRLFRRKNSPYWQAIWTDAQGAVHEQSTGCRDQEAARLWLADKELSRERERAGIPVARPISLADAASDYLAEREPDLAPRWWDTVEGFMRLQVVPHFGENRTVASIARPDVARFRAAQVGRPQLRFRSGCCRKTWTRSSAGKWSCSRCGAEWDGSHPVSPATVNRLFWAMGAFGSWCVERRYAIENAWAGHESFAEDQLPPPVIPEEAFEQLLAALEKRSQATFPWRALFELAAETGLRKGELGRLAWKDIEEVERRAWVVSSGSRGHNKARRLRSVALSQRALAVLKALPRRKDGHVFGKVPDPRRAFAAAAKGAGLERVWLHLMRHQAASRIGRAGAGTADLMAFGGWSSPRMAMRYTHSDHRRQVELVDRASGAPGANVGGTPQAQKKTGGQLVS
jgi:integrase